MYFALWDRLGENPIVQKEVQWWEDNRRKRKHGDTRDAAAMANKSAKMQVKGERRAATVEKYSM